jgi:hypothetical protein
VFSNRLVRQRGFEHLKKRWRFHVNRYLILPPNFHEFPFRITI